MKDAPTGTLEQGVALDLTLELLALGVLAPAVDLGANALIGPGDIEDEAQRVEVELCGGAAHFDR